MPPPSAPEQMCVLGDPETSTGRETGAAGQHEIGGSRVKPGIHRGPVSLRHPLGSSSWSGFCSLHQPETVIFFQLPVKRL